MKNIVKATVAGAIVVAGLTGGAANADTTGTTFLVNATVLKSCAVTALPLAFGNYDANATADDTATTTLTIICTPGTSFQTGLSAGGGTGATVSARSMTSGTNSLNYGLYQDAAHNVNWGNTPGTDTPAPVVAAVGAATQTVYGSIPAGQNVPLGVYQDTISVTVTY